ncbi:hypothetical protein H4R34_002197 [Dimargaris verticillata]|uniref:Uncharacterized protein n=1 Tax=Dimargaris verticillata TaxID=2761393 RepID=A0A9W8B8F6_9FUNG|nr:hypothetical protein H4R34_002197 [Dimargaris verticillata]
MVCLVKTSIVWTCLTLWSAVVATDRQLNDFGFPRDYFSLGSSPSTKRTQGVLAQDLGIDGTQIDDQWWNVCSPGPLDRQVYSFSQDDNYGLGFLNSAFTADSGSSSDPYQSSSSNSVWSPLSWDTPRSPNQASAAKVQSYSPSWSPHTPPELNLNGAQEKQPSESSSTSVGSLPPPPFLPLPIQQAQLPPVILPLGQSMKWLDVPSLDAHYAATLRKPVVGIWPLDQLDGPQAQSKIDLRVYREIQTFHEAVDDYYTVLIQREREQGGTLNVKDYVPFSTQLCRSKASHWEENGHVVFLVLWDDHDAMYKAIFPYTDNTFPLLDRAVYDAAMQLPTPFIRVFTVGTTRHAGMVAASVRRKLESLNTEGMREEFHQLNVRYGLPPLTSR